MHVCISIPPKYAVANVVGYLKAKSAIQIARKYGGRQRNFTGENFWAAAISSPPSGSMRRWCGPTFAVRSLRMSATIK